MKILITGAAGFIASHTAERLLNDGYDIVGIDNLNPYYSTALKQDNVRILQAKGASITIGDLTRLEDFASLPQDVDYIIHFAAQPGISATTSFEEYLQNNIVATKNLVDFALKCTQLKMLINISTSSVYGALVAKDEQTISKPVSWYGITKLAAEKLVLAQSETTKFKACSLRLYSVYGPRERPDKLYSKLIDCVLHDKPFPLFEGSLAHTRSYTYVEDIVDGIVACIGKEDTLNGEVINLGNDMQYSTEEGIKIIEKLLSKSALLDLQPPRPGDQHSTLAVIDKAKKLLNYAPKTNLENGLRKQVNWFLEREGHQIAN